MNKLDEALVELRQDINDPKKQSAFYDLFLNSNFFVPIVESRKPEGAAGDDGTRDVVPVVMEAEGNDYLMVFSTFERLKEWLKGEDSEYMEVPGYALAMNSMEPLHWALNHGTDFSKQFLPSEIAWLREAVERCNTEAAKEREGCCE